MYQRQAQGLASLGRGPDTELVHMTQGEVGALDNLARRTGFEGLPVNPQTGLPEAGIFSNILPMLVGAGAAIAAPFTGGGTLAALLANPWVLGGTGALVSGAATGWDPNQMAKWGLGLPAGAGVASGLMGAGAATPAAQTAGASAEQIAAETSRQAGIRAAEKAGQTATASTLKGLGGSAPFTTQSLGRAQLGNVRRAFSGEGLKNLAGLGAKGTALGTLPLYTGAGSLMASQYGKESEPFDPIVKKREYDYPEGGFFPPPRTSINPFAGELTPTDTGEETYFYPEVFTPPGYIPAKGGGLMGLKQYEEGGEVSAPSISVPTPDAGEASYFTPSRAASFTSPAAQYTGGVSPLLSGDYVARDGGLFHKTTGRRFDIGQAVQDYRAASAPAFTPRTRNYAESAPFNYGQPDTGELSYFNQGGLTRGAGDGMSDDIMLPITGSRDIAAVSPDEFVVPADVVSGLGNGSTSAGAKQLYSMMDNVRNTRTGKKTQPREINPDRMLPA